VALSNHDRERQATRLSASVGRDRLPDRDAIAKAAAVLILALRGAPFLYYGEEIGMVDVDIPYDEIVDPPALRAGPDFPWYDRSRCRTPMQWTSGPGAGFTTGRPWIRLAPDAETRNVAAHAADPDSIYAAYRRLLAYRAGSDALRRGPMERLASGDPDVLAWTRGAGDDRLLVLVSFVGEARRIDVRGLVGDGWRPAVGTHREPAAVAADGTLELRPDEALILERTGA
jgi:alpha-glucosidase